MNDAAQMLCIHGNIVSLKEFALFSHNAPTLSRLTQPPKGENRLSVTGQRTGAHGWSITE